MISVRVVAMILDCNEIIPGRLWIGSRVRAGDVKLLKQMGITTVVNLQTDADLSDSGISFKKLLKAYSEAEIEIRRVPVIDFDSRDLAERLPLCVSEVEAVLTPRWTRVYLHCTAGVNRSPTTAAAYLIRSQGMTALEAYDSVRDRRYCDPDLDVLERYASSLRCATRSDAPRSRPKPRSPV
jgi:protein-tyrosine phosphatase